MKTLAISLLLGGLLATVGCERKTTQADVQRDVKRAVQTVQQYTFDQRQDFAEKTRKDIERMRVELRDLRARTESESGDAKVNSEAVNDSIQRQLDAADAQLKEISNATESTWKDVRDRTGRLIDDIGDALRRATR